MITFNNLFIYLKNHVGPLGFYGRQPSGNIEEQKRDLELEQRRRQQEEMEHRANVNIKIEKNNLFEFNYYLVFLLINFECVDIFYKIIFFFNRLLLLLLFR